MKEVLSFLGEYTWGVIPASARDFVFWVLVAWAVLVFVWILNKLPKTTPEGIRGYDQFNPSRSVGLSVNVRDGTLGSFTAHDVAEANREVILIAHAVAILLLILPCLRVAGMITFSKDPVMSENVAVRTLTAGETVGILSYVYTCARTTNGPVFIRSIRGSPYAFDQTLYETTSRSEKKDPVWWGSFESIHLEKKKYVCQG